MESYLLAQAAGTKAYLGGNGVVDELGDGSAVLRPAVHQLVDPFAEQANIELAFRACGWLTGPGRPGPPHSATLWSSPRSPRTNACLMIPRSRTLHRDHPTYWMAPGIPHDAYLGEFLMRTKAVIRD